MDNIFFSLTALGDYCSSWTRQNLSQLSMINDEEAEDAKAPPQPNLTGTWMNLARNLFHYERNPLDLGIARSFEE